MTTNRSLNITPTWSPDGRSIAWLTFHDDRADVVVAAADGSGIRNVTDDAAREVRTSWSPDGAQIIVVSDRSGWWNLYRFNLASAAVRHGRISRSS